METLSRIHSIEQTAYYANYVQNLGSKHDSPYPTDHRPVILRVMPTLPTKAPPHRFILSHGSRFLLHRYGGARCPDARAPGGGEGSPLRARAAGTVRHNERPRRRRVTGSTLRLNSIHHPNAPVTGLFTAALSELFR